MVSPHRAEIGIMSLSLWLLLQSSSCIYLFPFNSISHASAKQVLQAVNFCSLLEDMMLMKKTCVVKAGEGNLKEMVFPQWDVWVGELQPMAAQRGAVLNLTH